MIQKHPIADYATHRVAKQKDVKWAPAMLGKDFRLSDQEWADLRQVMDSHKVALTDSIWNADRPFILRQLRSELALAANLGQLERYKILVEDDTQLQGALELFPRASKLMSQALEPPKRGRP